MKAVQKCCCTAFIQGTFKGTGDGVLFMLCHHGRGTINAVYYGQKKNCT